MKTIVIIPTFNEGRNIVELVKTIFGINGDYHLLVIDDNSPDGTADRVGSLIPAYPHLHLIRRPGKMGLGTAYCLGFKYALDHGFDVIVQMDADFSHNPHDIPTLVELLNECDVVIGSRYCDGVSVVRWPIRRLILSYGGNLYARMVTGLPVKDTTSGFKCWRRQVLKAIDLSNVRSEGYSFQIEMTFRAWIKGFSIKETPIIFIERTVGESKMSRSIMLEAILMVWRFKFWKLFGWHK